VKQYVLKFGAAKPSQIHVEGMAASRLGRTLSRRIFLGALPLLVSAAKAQEPADKWPSRPVRFFVSSTAGSAGDVVCRIVAQQLSERLGQPFVIDDKPAAGGTLAAEVLAHSKPDGYTIGMITTSTHVISKIFDPTLPFDPVKDFAPVSMIGSSPYVLVVNPGLQVKTVADLLSLAKSQKQPINNATYGTNTLGYLVGLRFAQMAGVDINQVPYRSSAEAVIDVMEGRVQMQFSTLPPAIPLIQAGKLRPLATTGAHRVERLPDIPTLAEQGLPGFDAALWIGIAAPAGMPPSIVTKLNSEITAVLNTPESRNALELQNFVAEPAPPSYIAGRISGDVGLWRDVVAKAGAQTQAR
jgi:tripartite-type tricarboxylate transporter receptor subunit TctC